MLRVIIAARLSKATEGDGQTGLETQTKLVRAYCAARGWEVVDVVSDRKSGTVPPWERKKLKAWVTDPDKLGIYDAVIGYRMDRLTRGDNQATNAIESWAYDHGKQLLTEDGLVFPCEGADGIRWDLAKRLAHEEWLKIRERTKRGHAAVLDAGFLVSKLPWGYVSTGRKGSHGIAPTDECREVWPQVCDRLIGGESLSKVCNWLRSLGMRDAKGKPRAWWPRTLGVMVRNSTYAGRHRQHGQTMRCEAVITDLVFRQAGKALDSRPKRGRQSETPALASSILRCGMPDCDATDCKPGESPMYRVHAYGGVVYRCTGRGPARKGCGYRVPCDLIDRQIDEVAAHLTRPVKVWTVIPGQNWKTEIAETAADIRDLDPEADDYAEMHAALMAKLADYKARPATEDTGEWRETEESYSERWAVAGARERRAMLASWEFTWTALREDDGHVLKMGVKAAV